MITPGMRVTHYADWDHEHEGTVVEVGTDDVLLELDDGEQEVCPLDEIEY